jgi:hypothetical protein
MPIEADNLRIAHERDGLVVGVISTDGVLRTRLEIDTFIKDVPMTNLYLLALQELKALDWRDRFSFFQIAGRTLHFSQNKNRSYFHRYTWKTLHTLGQGQS